MGSNEADKSAKEKETKAVAAAPSTVHSSPLVINNLLVAFFFTGYESC